MIQIDLAELHSRVIQQLPGADYCRPNLRIHELELRARPSSPTPVVGIRRAARLSTRLRLRSRRSVAISAAPVPRAVRELSTGRLVHLADLALSRDVRVDRARHPRTVRRGLLRARHV